MTLYLKVAVGPSRYLIAAAQVMNLGPADESSAANAALPAVDCRLLFGARCDASGYRVLVGDEAALSAALIVDRVDGLAEIADEDLRPLPAIGRFGALIDAISLPVAAEAPALRLQLCVAAFAELLARESIG